MKKIIIILLITICVSSFSLKASAVPKSAKGSAMVGLLIGLAVGGAMSDENNQGSDEMVNNMLIMGGIGLALGAGFGYLIAPDKSSSSDSKIKYSLSPTLFKTYSGKFTGGIVFQLWK